MELRKLTIAVAACMLAGAGQILLAWSPPERVDRRPANYRANAPALAVGDDSAVHVAWYEAPDSNPYLQKVMYAFRTCDTWSIPLNISRDSGDLRFPTIVLDSGGRPLVVWSEEGRARLRYVRQVGDTWSLPRLCFTNNGITPRLVTDSRGTVHLLFEEYTGHGGIWYSYYVADPDSWATPVAVATASQPLGWSSLAVDRYDRLYAVWMDWGTLGLGYARRDSAGWNPAEQMPDLAPNAQSGTPDVAADTFGDPHVVWDEGDGIDGLFYTTRHGDTWATPQRALHPGGYYPVICCDRFNRVHVAWNWDALYHAMRVDTGWSGPEVITTAPSVACEIHEGPSLLHLVYYQAMWMIAYTTHPVAAGCLETERQHPSSPPVVTNTRGGLAVGIALGSDARVSLTLVDATGRSVGSQDFGWLCRGDHTLTVDAESLPLGVCFLLLDVGGTKWTGKAVIVKPRGISGTQYLIP